MAHSMRHQTGPRASTMQWDRCGTKSKQSPANPSYAPSHHYEPSLPAVDDADELRRCCLGKPGAGEDFPFGEQVSVFKVAGKMFAPMDLDGIPLAVSLKCDPALAETLRSQHAAIRSSTGSHS